MNPDQWYIDGCLKASPEDVALFEKWTSHLPKREESTPYHSGAHSIRHFYNALRISGVGEGFRVLETGFCLGHSCEIFYGMGAHWVCSIEPSARPQTEEAMQIVKMRHPNFQLCRKFPPATSYDFGFIDGDHSAEAIKHDIEMMRFNKVPWVLFDDFWPHWGDTQQVMQELGITPVAILGTMALCDFR